MCFANFKFTQVVFEDPLLLVWDTLPLGYCFLLSWEFDFAPSTLEDDGSVFLQLKEHTPFAKRLDMTRLILQTLQFTHSYTGRVSCMDTPSKLART